jgi:hypothetical protein
MRIAPYLTAEINRVVFDLSPILLARADEVIE